MYTKEFWDPPRPRPRLTRSDPPGWVLWATFVAAIASAYLLARVGFALVVRLLEGTL